jgi:hypothetical protein
MQAVNISGQPVAWWASHSSLLGGNGEIAIDGELLELPEPKQEYIWGWASEHTCGTPKEWTLTLPPRYSPGPGRHTLRFSVTSKGGVYKNANRQNVPLLNGRLESNEIEFVIGE